MSHRYYFALLEGVLAVGFDSVPMGLFAVVMAIGAVADAIKKDGDS